MHVYARAIRCIPSISSTKKNIKNHDGILQNKEKTSILQNKEKPQKTMTSVNYTS